MKMQFLIYIWLQCTFSLLFQSQVSGRCNFDYHSSVSKTGNFTTPRFPNNYPESVECYYNFVGGEFEALRLTFFIFDLEPPFSKGCLSDYADISTITHFDVKQLVGRFCGTEVPSPLLSMHPKAEIIFKSNHVASYRGFHGMYEFLDEKDIPAPQSSRISGCGGNERGVGGILISPSYPKPFPRKVDCFWLIRVDTDQHIYVRVLELQLYGSIANCNDAELAIYDGFTNIMYDSKSMKKYCGDLRYYKNMEEKVELSRRNRLLIRFRADISSSAWGETSSEKMYGFKIMWTAVSFERKGHCKGFACKHSQYCLNSASRTCTETRQYCIDRALVCDGLPNCSEMDQTDEEKCSVPLLAGTGVGVGAAVLCALIAILLYRRHVRVRKSLSQTQALTMQLRQLEHSPSFANRQVTGHFIPPPTELLSPGEANCAVHSPYGDGMLNNRYGTYPTDV